MIFGKTSTSKTFERADIQPAIELAVEQVLQSLGMRLDTLDIPHTRRMIRALTRIAARIARKHGCDVQTFLLIAHECFQTEQAASVRAQA